MATLQISSFIFTVAVLPSTYSTVWRFCTKQFSLHSSVYPSIRAPNEVKTVTHTAATEQEEREETYPPIRPINQSTSMLSFVLSGTSFFLLWCCCSPSHLPHSTRHLSGTTCGFDSPLVPPGWIFFPLCNLQAGKDACPWMVFSPVCSPHPCQNKGKFTKLAPGCSLHHWLGKLFPKRNGKMTVDRKEAMEKAKASICLTVGFCLFLFVLTALVAWAAQICSFCEKLKN